MKFTSRELREKHLTSWYICRRGAQCWNSEGGMKIILFYYFTITDFVVCVVACEWHNCMSKIKINRIYVFYIHFRIIRKSSVCRFIKLLFCITFLILHTSHLFLKFTEKVSLCFYRINEIKSKSWGFSDECEDEWDGFPCF